MAWKLPGMGPVLRTGGWGLAIAALLLLSPGSSNARSGGDEAEIRERLQRWTADFNAGRWAALCDLFAADLIADYQGQPQKSYDSVCAALLALEAAPRRYHYDLDIHEVMVSGELATVRLTWTLTVTGYGIAGEERVVDIGLDVFRKDPDGVWRIARYVAFPTAAN